MASTPRSLPLPIQVAKVKSLAVALGSVADTDASNNDKVDKRILDRIQKCLDRAHHPNTPEAEVKAALRMSSRLMAQFNVTQSEVLAAADTSEKMAQLSGQSNVQITSTKVGGRVINQTWVYDVTSAMNTFFDCKSYSTDCLNSIEWTFYGIAGNTVAAAMSFEMVHNLVQDWARFKKGITTRNSYCLGIGNGLYRIATKEKQREEQEAKKKEETELKLRVEQENKMRQIEVERLKITIEDDNLETMSSRDSRSTSSASYVTCCEFLADTETFSEDDAYINEGDEMLTTFKEAEEEPLNPFDDFEAQLRSITNHQNHDIKLLGKDKITSELVENQIPATKGVHVSNDPGYEDSQPLGTWASSSALTLFRQKSNDVADEYLRSKNVKLNYGGTLNRSIRDYDAYRQGQKDSSKIDVKRRRIEDAI